MPAFRVQVFYQRGANEKWTNVYHVFSATMAGAITAINSGMTAHLLDLLDPSCTLVKYLVSDPSSLAYTEVPVGVTGAMGAGNVLIPLFNSVKVRWPTAAAGRPDYKFYKGFIGENNQSSGNVESAAMTAIFTELSGMLADVAAAGAALCSEAGDAWGVPVVQQAIQMRQMHRKRRRPPVVP